MAVQTSYSERIRAYFNGQVVDETNRDGESLTCETAAGIGFGCAVSKGSAEKGGVLGGAVTDFRGVAVRDVTVRPSGTDEYAQYDTMDVLFRGDVAVPLKNDVAAGGAAYYDATTGLWDDAASGNVGPVKGAMFVTAGLQNGNAVLRLTGAQGDN